jgi:hypothetical protein
MKKITVNNGRDDAQFDIEKVEAKYNAKFVGQFCLKTRDGDWANSPADVYYQEIPPVEGYSKYFALIYQGGSVYITSGASAVTPVINAVVADDGEVIYSRYRHDYRTSKDGSVSIDGGRDYIRSTLHGRFINLKIVDGEFYELEHGDLDMPKDEQEHIASAP